MQYWEEMNNKYGFGDGSAYPAGVELYRDVYLKTVNKLAENRNSDLRIVPFDRAGVHNYCLWMVVPKDWFENVYLPKQKPGEQWSGAEWGDLPDPDAPEPQPDAGLEAAIEEAMGLDLDSFVEVNPVLAEGFEKFLNDM